MGPKPSRTVWPRADFPNDPKCVSEPGQYHMEESEPSHLSLAQIPEAQAHELLNCGGLETLNFGVFCYSSKD